MWLALVAGCTQAPRSEPFTNACGALPVADWTERAPWVLEVDATCAAVEVLASPRLVQWVCDLTVVRSLKGDLPLGARLRHAVTPDVHDGFRVKDGRQVVWGGPGTQDSSFQLHDTFLGSVVYRQEIEGVPLAWTDAPLFPLVNGQIGPTCASETLRDRYSDIAAQVWRDGGNPPTDRFPDLVAAREAVTVHYLRGYTWNAFVDAVDARVPVARPSAGFNAPGSAAFLCTVPDTVVIGTVLRRDSFRIPGGGLDSIITLDVERVVKGVPADPLAIRIGGGVLDGRPSTDSWSPRATPGDRLALFVTTIGVPEPVISSFQDLDESVPLPPEQDLVAAFDRACAQGVPVTPFLSHAP